MSIHLQSINLFLLYFFLIISNINSLLNYSQYLDLYSLYNETNGDNWLWLNESKRWIFTTSYTDPCDQSWEGLCCTYNQEQNYSVVSVLNLSAHNLVGSLSPSLFVNLSSTLTHVSLGSNKIYGLVPTSLGLASKISFLAINSNSFHGPVFPIIEKLSELATLDIRSNFLNGSLPSTIGKLTKLLELSISDNFFNGYLVLKILTVCIIFNQF